MVSLQLTSRSWNRKQIHHILLFVVWIDRIIQCWNRDCLHLLTLECKTGSLTSSIPYLLTCSGMIYHSMSTAASTTQNCSCLIQSLLVPETIQVSTNSYGKCIDVVFNSHIQRSTTQDNVQFVNWMWSRYCSCESCIL